MNDQLVQAAQIQATQMADLDDMSHDLPNAPLPELQDRLAYVGYQFSAAGENIATYYYDANSVMTAWMNSRRSGASIDLDYTEIGVSIAVLLPEASRNEPKRQAADSTKMDSWLTATCRFL